MTERRRSGSEARLEPVPLEPMLVERVWGGSGLAALFAKPLPPGRPIGESWEAADLGDAVSRVASGPHAGRTLRELVERFGPELAGSAVLPDGRLPLLFKLIDAREVLSVQLHPDDDEVAPGSGCRGKEEAWYILAAEPGARLICGLAPGETIADLCEAIERGAPEELLAWQEVAPGQVYYVPPGTVHAIGAGIILAEIQESSDITYRLYDWGRVGLDGKPRQLHVEQAKRVRQAGPVPCPHGPIKRGARPGEPDLLVAGRHFRLLRLRLDGRAVAEGELADRFAIVFAVEGAAELACAARGAWTIERGTTWLLPASAGAWRIEGKGGRFEALWMEPEGFGRTR